MRKYEEDKRHYENMLRELKNRPRMAMELKTKSMNQLARREAIEAAEKEKWARTAQQQEEARRTQQRAQEDKVMQTYRQLISNAPDTSVFPYAAINYAMTGQPTLPANLSANQRIDLFQKLHPSKINSFNYLSQHSPSFNLAQELQYLRNLAESRVSSAAAAQARSLNDALRNLKR